METKSILHLTTNRPVFDLIILSPGNEFHSFKKIIMNRESILQSNLPDMIFENRNKDYGAYALRKEYNSRMCTALFSMIGTCLFFCVLFFFKKSDAILGP